MKIKYQKNMKMKKVYIQTCILIKMENIIQIYINSPKEELTSIHINIDNNTGCGSITDTTGGSKETNNSVFKLYF